MEKVRFLSIMDHHAAKVFLIFNLLFFILVVSPVFAATYYISPSGSDSNPGTQANPFATFSHAFSQMSGGDTLYVMDGVYNEQVTGMPSGTAGNYTEIYAVNDHAVDVDGQGTLPDKAYEALLYINNKSYIKIRGITFHDSYNTNNVGNISGSNHIEIKVCGFWQAGTYKHAKPLYIGTSSNILIEDVWAFGRGRYTVHLGSGAENCTLRRVVTRWDDGMYTSEPIAGFTLYKAYNNIVENCITLDHRTSNHPAGHEGYYLISWNASYPETKDNDLYGCIALNLPVKGFSNETNKDTNDDNNTFTNCVAVDCSRGIQIQAGRGCILRNNSAINCSGDGFRNNVRGINTSFKNNLAVGCGGDGFINNGGTYTSFDYNGYYNNSTNRSGFSAGANDRSDNPSLLYPIRIEPDSNYKGAGEGGGDIGANIIKRYENGSLTANNLWPWPYEDWIKADMCGATQLTEVGRTGGNTPDWCKTDKTLTQYIWGYIGNTLLPPYNLKIISK